MNRKACFKGLHHRIQSLLVRFPGAWFRRIRNNIVVKPGFRHTNFRSGPSTHRDSGLMHRFSPAGNQRMPPVQIFALVDETIGACRRKPGIVREIIGAHDHAVVDLLVTILVIRTATRADIQKAACQACMIQFFRICILEFQQATLAATVAKRFPFPGIQLIQAFRAPKGLIRYRHLLCLTAEMPNSLI